MVDHAVPITEIYITGVQPDKALIRQYEVEQDDAIDAEVARAEGVESGLQSGLTGEISRAESAEAALSEDVAGIDTSIAAIEATLATIIGQIPTGPKYAANGPARLATTGALASYAYNNGAVGVGATITLSSTGTLTIDGSVVALGDRILVRNETGGNAPNNGLYSCTTAGATGVDAVLTRATDADAPSELNNLSVFISSGTSNTNKTFTNIDPVTTVGTSNILFNQTSGGYEFRTSFFQAFATPLTAADTAAAASGAVLVIDTNETLSGSVTFTAAAVRFAGGKITLGSNNLTIPYANYENFSDPIAQIFVQTGSGIVIFSKTSSESPCWWGMTSNGSAPSLTDEKNNTSAMQAAHKAVFSNATGSEIVWPDGYYVFANGTNQTNTGTVMNVPIGYGPISHRGASAEGVRWYVDPTTIPTNANFIGFFGGGNPLTGDMDSGTVNSAFIGNSIFGNAAANLCTFFGAMNPSKIVDGFSWENIHYVYDPTPHSGSFLGTGIQMIPLYLFAVYNGRMRNCRFIGAPNDGANWTGSGSWDDCHFALNGFYSGSADGQGSRNGGTFTGWQDALNPDLLTTRRISITNCTFEGNADTGFAFGGCSQNTIIDNCSANGNQEAYEGILSHGERLTQWQADVTVDEWDCYYTSAGKIFQYTNYTQETTGSSEPTGSVGDTGIADGTAVCQCIGTMPSDNRVAATYTLSRDRSDGTIPAYFELPLLGKVAKMAHIGGNGVNSTYYFVANCGNEKRVILEDFEAKNFGYASATSSAITIVSNNGGEASIRRGTLDGCYLSSSTNGMIAADLDGQVSWGGYHQGTGANNKGRLFVDVRIKNPSVQSASGSSAYVFLRGSPASYDININADRSVNSIDPPYHVVVEHAYHIASKLEYGIVRGCTDGNSVALFRPSWTVPSGSSFRSIEIGPGKFRNGGSSGTITSPLTGGLMNMSLSSSSALSGLLRIHDNECSWAGAVNYLIADGSGNLTGGVNVEAIGNSFCEAPAPSNWWLLQNGLLTGTTAFNVTANSNPATPGQRVTRGTATPTAGTWMIGDSQERSNAAASGILVEQATRQGTLDTTPMNGCLMSFAGSVKSGTYGGSPGTPPLAGQWITITGDGGNSRLVVFANGGVVVSSSAPANVTAAAAAYYNSVHFASLSLSS